MHRFFTLLIHFVLWCIKQSMKFSRKPYTRQGRGEEGGCVAVGVSKYLNILVGGATLEKF